MTTDIKQLPLPSVLLNWPHPTNHVAIRDYARAVAEHNVKERDAEIERLRAIIDNREAIIATHAADTREYQKQIMHAEARAERLAEALRGLLALPIAAVKGLLTCYQCGKTVTWLAPDSRCGDCTRLTPDEVRG